MDSLIDPLITPSPGDINPIEPPIIDPSPIPEIISPTTALSVKTLVAISIILFYITVGRMFEKINFYFIHESGLCMLLGMIVSLISFVINPLDSFSKTLRFDDAIFFNFILPPIIFSAGYNLRCKNFFMYFHYSIIFGIIGTCITLLLIATFTYIINLSQFFTVNFTLKEILLFSSVISATDTVTPLAFLDEDKHNKLFTVLFGEGIMNDSFSIVAYQIFTKYYSMFSKLQMISYFLYLFIVSLLLGIGIGFLCSLFLKYTKSFKLHRHQEISILLLFAFISYTLAEALDLSAVISLLFCSIALSNYAFYNLSFTAREESCIVVKIISNLAEAFVFTYLGLTFCSMSQTNYSILFITVEFVLITLARFFTIYILTGITNLVSSSPFISIEKKVISLAGCIRGAIAFGLAMSINTGNQISDSILLSTTLVLVFGSTLVFGAIIPVISRNIKIRKSSFHKKEDSLPPNESFYLMSEDENNTGMKEKLLPQNENNDIDYLAKENILRRSSFKYEHPNNKNFSRADNYENLSGISRIWFSFDRDVLKPLLVYDWENCIKEHIDLSQKIKKVIDTGTVSD
ncbi:MAG: cation:proton antiporter [archaeon]|nr:cation:proton antiporter [archaeon]